MRRGCGALDYTTGVTELRLTQPHNENGRRKRSAQHQLGRKSYGFESLGGLSELAWHGRPNKVYSNAGIFSLVVRGRSQLLCVHANTISRYASYAMGNSLPTGVGNNFLLAQQIAPMPHDPPRPCENKNLMRRIEGCFNPNLKYWDCLFGVPAASIFPLLNAR